MSHIYSVDAPKKATNISVNSDLIAKAKAYKINLSATLENELERIIRKKMEEEWLEKNKEAIEENNRRVAKRGTFSQMIGRI